MNNQYLSVADAAALISSGAPVIVAATENVLDKLPRGKWVGASTPYFMTADGGRQSTSEVFCTVVDEAEEVTVANFGLTDLAHIPRDGYDRGFSYVVLPGFSESHRVFALEAPSYEGIFDRPLMGWIAGVDVGDIGKVSPVVFDGTTGEKLADAAVVMHVRLPDGETADIDIVNLFEQGDGASIEFPETGWSASTCTVDGVSVNFAQWIAENNIDTRQPLVANYSGTMINVSFQAINDEAGTVDFYAPVVAGEIYKIAKSVPDYSAAYAQGVSGAASAENQLSCNCILNYLYAELEGKSTSGFVGPVTFGEVAYILLNQTLVHLSVESSKS